MIAVRLEGRLGNQLFQYAFIYAAAKRLNTSFYIDKSLEEFIPARYFTIQKNGLKNFGSKVFLIPGYKNLFSFYLKKAYYKTLQALLFGKKPIFISNEQQPAEALTQVTNGRMYWGFFQSEQYFTGQTSNIKQLFIIKNEFVEDYNKAVNTSSNRKVVAIHVRRGDYADLGFTLPMDYYHRALAIVGVDDVDFIFISDDTAFVEQNFAYITNKYISKNNEIVDLQILMNADVCILANSSFSWWGAYLNNKNAKVIAPNNWLGTALGKELPTNVIPSHWIKL